MNTASLPDFVIGVLLLWIFAATLQWFPVSSAVILFGSAEQAALLQQARLDVLPARRYPDLERRRAAVPDPEHRVERHGRPLQAMLDILQIQYDAVEANIAALYESWFIETCPAWVTPGCRTR